MDQAASLFLIYSTLEPIDETLLELCLKVHIFFMLHL